MTLLEQTYEHLSRAGLTSSAEAFSRDYLGKSRSWFAYQKHAGRDFSVAAAVQCLRSLRSRQAELEMGAEKQAALVEATDALLSHLREKHLVADVTSHLRRKN